MYVTEESFIAINKQTDIGIKQEEITGDTLSDVKSEPDKVSYVSTVESLFTNKFSEDKNILGEEWCLVTNTQAGNSGWQQAGSIGCCVTFAQYTYLLEFAVPSLEFLMCFVVFFSYSVKYFPFTNV
jgi:hypothetical protein